MARNYKNSDRPIRVSLDLSEGENVILEQLQEHMRETMTSRTLRRIIAFAYERMHELPQLKAKESDREKG
jgi:hypothetical protein